MKRITKPSQREEATYYSDFSGKHFGNYCSPVEVKIEFNYGSKYDGSLIGLHLTDDEVEFILDVIKKRTTSDYKDFLKKCLHKNETNELDAAEFRDWDSCKMIQNSTFLLEKLLEE